MNRRVLIAAFGIFLIIFTAILFLVRGSTDPSVLVEINNSSMDKYIQTRSKIRLRTGIEVLPQRTYDRIYKEYAGEHVREIDLLELGINNPMYPEVSGDTLYFVDKERSKIKIISAEGELLGTVGNGDGRGPGEFLSIYDIAVRGDTLYVADHFQMKISLLTHDNAIIDEYSIPEVSKIAPRGSLIVIKHRMGKYVLGLFDMRSERTDDFALDIFKNPLNILNASDGHLVSDKTGTVYSSYFYCGFIAGVNRTGEVLYLRETMSSPGYMPERVTYTSGNTVLRSDYVISGSLHYYENELFIVGGIITSDGQHPRTVVDVYEAATGYYKESFLVNGGDIRDVLVNDSYIFSLDDEGILRRIERL